MLTRWLAGPLVAATLVIFLSPSVAWAQAPGTGFYAGPDGRPAADAAPFELTMEEAENPPRRELEFEERSEALTIKLKRPDPKLLEKKYVAKISVKLPSENAHRSDLKELNGLQATNQGLILFPNNYPRPQTPADSLGAALRRIIDTIPEDRRPKQDEVAFIQASPADIETTTAQDGVGQRSTRDFYIYAESVEAAREQSATLLKVLDEGLTRPFQVTLMQEREGVLKQLEAAEQQLAKDIEERDRLRKDAEEVSEFPVDLLPGLRVQQLQLEVDLAGTKSRIEACEKLLNDSKTMSAERRSKVFDIKMAAEIDLASFEARQKTTAGFIENVKRSRNVGQALASVSAQVSNKERSIRNTKMGLKRIESQITAYQPLVLTGKIQIQPLKWE